MWFEPHSLVPQRAATERPVKDWFGAVAIFVKIWGKLT